MPISDSDLVQAMRDEADATEIDIAGLRRRIRAMIGAAELVAGTPDQWSPLHDAWNAYRRALTLARASDRPEHEAAADLALSFLMTEWEQHAANEAAT